MAKVLSNLRVTQHYGHNGHNGVDLGATSDRKVYANAEGIVEATKTGLVNFKGSTGVASWGNYVLIKHPNGMKTRYAHLSKVYVSAGQHVAAGQLIGLQGDSGNAYGVHLHYEVYNTAGTRINPEPYMETPVYNSNNSSKEYTGEIKYKVYTYSIKNKKEQWLGEVNSHNSADYAGNEDYSISGIKAYPQYGEIKINSHVKGGSWCGEVSSNNYNGTDKNSYSGVLGKPIDLVKITCTKGSVSYRVYDIIKKKWLPWVKDGAIAGNEGNQIGAIQMK